MDKPLEDAEVSRATRKLSNGRSGGDAKQHGEYHKALEKGPETRAYLNEVLGGFWKSGSLPDGDTPTEPPQRYKSLDCLQRTRSRLDIAVLIFPFKGKKAV